MGPFILATIVIALCSYGFYVLNVAYKKKTVEDRVSFLLGPHATLEKEAATMQAAKKLLLEEVVKLYGNNFQEFPGREHLHADEFTSLLAARFDEYVIKRVLKVFGTSKEIRIYTLKKGGKSISIAVGMIPAEELIYEYVFYIPLNGYEMKTKEINEIIEMSKVRSSESKNAFFDVNRGELVSHTYDWSVYLKDAESNPVPVRVATNGKFGEMLLSELIETLRIKLFVEEGQHVGIFGSPGTGKTSLWRAWVEALLPILSDHYRIIFLSATQFEEWLEGYESWEWFNEELSKEVKTVIIVDDIPELEKAAWSTLLSLMDGKAQDELNVSFVLSWKTESKDELIRSLDSFTAKSIIRRLTYMVELRPYNKEEMKKRVEKIEELLISPYYYDREMAKQVLNVNTALSAASNIAPSELFLAVKRGLPPVKDAEVKPAEPKTEPKKIIRRL